MSSIELPTERVERMTKSEIKINRNVETLTYGSVKNADKL